jgi:spermidine synthase
VLRGGAGQRLPRRVGVIGLGAGTLATYGRPGDFYRFYEINPQALDVARNQFTFLRDSRARVNITLGDARLSLQNERNQHFDVLAADAFNGDSVPIHLLTEQAFALYFRHLVPRTGILAVHVSNTYLNLVPVVARAAGALGKYAVWISTDDYPPHAVYGSDWVLLASTRRAAQRLVRASDGYGMLVKSDGGRAWTDDYSNLIEALR